LDILRAKLFFSWARHIMKIATFSPELYTFLESHSFPCHPILELVAEETKKLPDAMMQIPMHQAGFMHLLIKLLNPKTAVEIGCYTGLSAIAIASALAQSSHLWTFDVDPKTSMVAQRYFTASGIEKKITLTLGPARQTLVELIRNGDIETIDFAFIDADKVNYEDYYEICINHMSPGGVLLLDNVFRDGEILSPAIKDLGTQAVARVVHRIKNDQRVEATLLPVADGLYLVRKI
jgi:predicted O-methyltransferase YrrM